MTEVSKLSRDQRLLGWYHRTDGEISKNIFASAIPTSGTRHDEISFFGMMLPNLGHFKRLPLLIGKIFNLLI